MNENQAHEDVAGDVAGERREILRRVMRRQAALSLRVAACFIVLLVVLPLANLFLPDLMGTKIGGFTLTWLILAILFYPITWALSAFFVRRSEDLEAELGADPTLKVSAK